MLGHNSHLTNIAARDGNGAVFVAENLQIAYQARPFSLKLGDGEVVAITGLVGAGKTELAETLFGVRRPFGGAMTLRGKAYLPRSTADAIAAGVFLVAKDRAESGIVKDFNLYENMSLPFLDRISSFGISRRRAERAIAREAIADLGIVCRSERDEMSTLSGGNQQKTMVARWMSQPASLFILDEPFQGVDIAARRDIANKLRASAEGRATLLFVTELDEALETADRILVMSENTIVGEHRNTDIDIDRLLHQIAGQPLKGAA
jgi:simple sugar transport system ATP-binding protein